MERLRNSLSYANVMATVAVFLALGGAAVAVNQAPPNSVTSRSVVNEALKGKDVKNDKLTGADIGDGTLTGGDIVESSLGEVPSATLGGVGRNSALSGICNPESSAFTNCVATDTINLSAPTRVLIIGQVRVYSETAGSDGFGSCRIGSNVGGFVPESLARAFVPSQTDSIAMSGVTGMVGPGEIAFGMDCNEISGGVQYELAHVSYVLLSPG